MQLADEHKLRQALLTRAQARGAEWLSLGVVARHIGVHTLALEAFISGAKLSRDALAALPEILQMKTPQKPADAFNRQSSHQGKVMDKTLTGRALKVTVMLDPAEVAALADPTTARVVLKIAVAGRTVTADIAGKSLRKAKAMVSEHGVDGVAVILQGKLVGDAVTEAGLVAQVKTPKPAETAA